MIRKPRRSLPCRARQCGAIDVPGLSAFSRPRPPTTATRCPDSKAARGGPGGGSDQPTTKCGPSRTSCAECTVKVLTELRSRERWCVPFVAGAPRTRRPAVLPRRYRDLSTGTTRLRARAHDSDFKLQPYAQGNQVRDLLSHPPCPVARPASGPIGSGWTRSSSWPTVAPCQKSGTRVRTAESSLFMTVIATASTPRFW